MRQGGQSGRGGRVRRGGLVVLMALVLAPAASAQIPLPFFKKKKKPPPPAETAAPGAKAPAELPAPGAPGARPDSQAAGQAPAITAPQAAPAAAAGALSPEEAAALQQSIEQAIAADAAGDTSMTHIQERMQRWLSITFRAPAGSQQATLAQQQYALARQDLQAAQTRAAEAGKADQQATTLLNAKLDAARVDIDSKNFGSAEQNIGFVLQQNPTHPMALSLQGQLARARRMADLKRQALFIMPVLVVLAAGLVVVVRWGAKFREERQRKLDEAAARRSAVLQIVDGLGRGKLVTLDKEKAVFKIGAAEGPSDAEKNDLLLSDSAKLVSRYHCTLLRKDGDYYLVDASLNGTMLNGRPVKRGEHHRLDDGDEITIAEVSRLKFLHT